MQFPLRDFTNQYISSSYQDVLQQYTPSDIFYVLDGYGNVVFSLPSSSIGQMLIAANMTASMTVISSSYSLNSTNSETSDFALLAGEAIRATTSSYALTASFVSGSATNSQSASYALNATNAEASDFALLSGDATTSTSASYALTTNNFRPTITTVTGSLILNSNYNTVLVSCSVSPIFVSLPSASLNNQKMFNVKKIDNTIQSVIIQTVDSSSIDDITFKTISTQYDIIKVQSNGIQYYVL